MARKSTGKRTRFEVFKRDNFTCQYCGRTPPAVVLHVDHIVPVSKGGDNDQLNLTTACSDCNLGKASKPLSSVITPLKDQIELERERRKQVIEYEKFLSRSREEKEALVQELGTYWYNLFLSEKDKFCFGKIRHPTIRRFADHLPKSKITEAMEIGVSRFFPQSETQDGQAFRYFCGVCWRMIRND